MIRGGLALDEDARGWLMLELSSTTLGGVPVRAMYRFLSFLLFYYAAVLRVRVWFRSINEVLVDVVL